MSMALLMTGSLSANLVLNSNSSSDIAIIASAADPFITELDNYGSIKVDESQINVSRKVFYGVSKLFFKSTTANTFKGSISTAFPMMDSGTVTLKVSGKGLTKEKLEKMNLNVTYKYDDCTSGVHSWEGKNAKVTPINTNTFTVEYGINVYGERMSFETSPLENVSDLKFINAAYKSDEDSIYYDYIKADAPEGYDDVCIRIRRTSSMTVDMEKKWAKHICVYANSLSHLTGVKNKTLFVFLDNRHTGQYGANFTYHVDSTGVKYPLVSGNGGFSRYIKNNMKNDNLDLFTWGEMHEISHAYGCSEQNPLIDNYHFDDDAITNARGLWVMQNCINFKSTEITFDGNGDAYNEMHRYSCEEAFSKRYELDKNGYYAFGEGLLNYDSMFDNHVLYQFFSFSNKDVSNDSKYDSKNNKAAAKIVNEVLGINGGLNNPKYLKLINTLRALSMISSNKAYNEKSFRGFLQTFRGDRIKTYFNMMNSNIYSPNYFL